MEEKQIALAAATLAGQMSLSGLILVYQGFAVSWWRSQIDSDNSPTMPWKKYHAFLLMTTFSVVVMLAATIVPILILIRTDSYAWTLPAVLFLSVGLVIVVAIQGYNLFLTSRSTIAPIS
jgi:uncharacterized membrane protein